MLGLWGPRPPHIPGGLAGARGTDCWWAGPEQVRAVCHTHCSEQKGDRGLEGTVVSCPAGVLPLLETESQSLQPAAPGRQLRELT